MTILAITLAVGLLINVLTNQHTYKRVRYLERDVAALQKTEEYADIYETTTPKLYPLPRDLEPEGVIAIERQLDDPKLKAAYEVAVEEGWYTLDHQDNIKMIRFTRNTERDEQKVNVYYGKKTGRTTYTVATALQHPYKGKTQLFRRGVDLEQLRKILKNPRQHTGNGYYKREA